MRTLVPFALALIGTVAFTADASAFGKRNRGGAGCYGSGYGCAGFSYGGCYGGGYGCSGYGSYVGGGFTSGGPVWSGVPVGYPITYSGGFGTAFGSSSWAPVIPNGGRAVTIQTTDGAYYTLGADGSYYPVSSNGIATLNGFTTQPYDGVPTMYRSSSYYYPVNVYPAGSLRVYNGSGVIPAGGTLPLIMPTADPAKLAPTTTNSFRAKQVLGTKIMIQNNTQVGTVEDIVFDDAGNMDYLIVSTDDNKLVTVPWDATKFDAEKKAATVNITPDVWKTVPTYTTTTYPQFYTPTYRTDIYKVYGLTPRELRRLERRIP